MTASPDDPAGQQRPAGSSRSHDALAALDDVLHCPVCGAAVEVGRRAVRCRQGHSFDRARQGYAGLLARPLRFHGDDAAMVAARRVVLSSGLYDPLLGEVGDLGAEALGARTGGSAPATVVDLGCGTGHYLARVLSAAAGRVPGGARGIGVDASKAAVRAAARAHPAAGALLGDAWAPVPIMDGSADVVMSVFAPRNPRAYARLPGPDGSVMIVAPDDGHLRGLVDALGLLRVQEGKRDRLADTMRGCGFVEDRALPVRWTMRPTPEQAEAMVAMGPSARHIDACERTALMSELSDGVEVAGEVTVRIYRRASRAGTGYS